MPVSGLTATTLRSWGSCREPSDSTMPRRPEPSVASRSSLRHGIGRGRGCWRSVRLLDVDHARPVRRRAGSGCTDQPACVRTPGRGRHDRRGDRCEHPARSQVIGAATRRYPWPHDAHRLHPQKGPFAASVASRLRVARIGGHRLGNDIRTARHDDQRCARRYGRIRARRRGSARHGDGLRTAAPPVGAPLLRGPRHLRDAEVHDAVAGQRDAVAGCDAAALGGPLHDEHRPVAPAAVAVRQRVEALPPAARRTAQEGPPPVGAHAATSRWNPTPSVLSPSRTGLLGPGTQRLPLSLPTEAGFCFCLKLG